jgi:hypothetical protein
MFVERWVSYSLHKQKMMSFRGAGSWAKLSSPGGKLTALACHLIIKLNKAEKLTYLSSNIGQEPTLRFIRVGSTLAFKYYVGMEVTDSDKCSSRV